MSIRKGFLTATGLMALLAGVGLIQSGAAFAASSSSCSRSGGSGDRVICIVEVTDDDSHGKINIEVKHLRFFDDARLGTLESGFNRAFTEVDPLRISMGDLRIAVLRVFRDHVNEDVHEKDVKVCREVRSNNGGSVTAQCLGYG